MHPFPKRSRRVAAVLIAACALPFSLSAQTAGAGPIAPNQSNASDTSSTQQQDTVLLNPFEVRSDHDLGYEATNANTATRISRPIYDTPLMINVVTSDFLNDTNAMARLDDVYRYIPGMAGDSRTDNTGRGLFGSDLGTARGFPISAVDKDGIPRNNNFNYADVQRVEVLKGPVSVFFGSAQPGGTINMVTFWPEFRNYGELTANYQTFDTSQWASTEQNTGGGGMKGFYNVHYKDLIAVRLSGYFSNTNGWRDREYFHQRGVFPSVTIRPFPSLKISTKFENLSSYTNPAGGTPNGNEQMFRDYLNPPANVLAANGLTAQQYQAALRKGGQTAWVVDAMKAVGSDPVSFVNNNLFTTTGMGYQVLPHWDPFSRPSFSFQGYHNFLNTRSITSTTFVTFTPSDWFSFRYGFYYDYTRADYISVHSSQLFPDMTTNVGTSEGQQSHRTDRYNQVNLLFKKTFFGIKNDLLLGYDYDPSYTVGRVRLFDYTKYPNTVTDANGNVLSGIAVFQHWDPRILRDPPEMADMQNGYGPWQNDRHIYNTARYASWDSEFTVFGHRVMPMAAVRKDSVGLITNSRPGDPTNILTSTPTAGDSFNYGLTFALTRSINLYASYNTNYVPNTGVNVTGVGVNRDISGNIIPGFNEVSKLPDQTGLGRDIGMKFNFLDGKISGVLGWYDVERSHIQAIDTVRNQNDPRDQPGILYPNASGVLQIVDSGFVPVTWYNTSGVQRNQGIETQVFITPVRNFQVIVSFSNIYLSKIMSNSTYSSATTNNGKTEAYVLLNRRNGKSPRYQGGVFAKYTVVHGPLKNVWVGGGVRGQTTMIATYTSYTVGPHTNPGFAVADFSAGYSRKLFGLPTDYRLAVTNVFDRLYVGGFFSYGNPRQISLAATTHF